MKRYFNGKVILVSCVLSACSSPYQNTEGKMLDASAPYCQELSHNNPSLYVDVCESQVGWADRDPSGYKSGYDKENTFSDIVVREAVERPLKKVVK